MATRTELNGLALCSGIGGLELGISRALRGYKTVGYVEREAYAATTLVARMEAKALDPAPIWDDLETFDGRPWRGLVDIVSVGFPCQPWSSAGRRQGTSDHRWLWPDILRIISESRPGVVFLENSPRVDENLVRGTLRGLRYTSRAVRVRASDVGAPHRRERWFCLAYADSDRRQSLGGRGVLDVLREALRDDTDGPSSTDVAFPPGPDDWGDWDGPQPSIRRDADGAAHRVDRLRCLGNAVVPQQAEAALRWLLEGN